MRDHNHQRPDDASIPNPTTLMGWAKAYCDAGFRVFPCRPDSKEPAIKAWQDHATNDFKIVTSWFAEFPDRNMAIATGPQPNGKNVLVIDIDPRHGGLDSWKQLITQFGGIPKTAVHTTPHGGFHLFFDAPGEFRNTRNKLGQGIDTRASGGYVLVPPSKLFVADNETRYDAKVGDFLWGG